MKMELINLAIVLAVFFIGSFFGSVMGITSLITVPSLIFLGLGPHAAIATTRIGNVGIGTGASLGYGQEKKIDYKFSFRFMIFASIGSILGTFTIVKVPEEILKNLIAIIMIVISIMMFFDIDFKNKMKKKHLHKYFFPIFALLSGFYLGFYGAGAGLINRIILVMFFGYTIIRGSAISIFSSIPATIVSLIIFLYLGLVELSLFVPILIISFIGAYIGSKYAVKIGNEKVKQLILIAAIIMAIKLLFF
jgi:uncharacterized protein